LEAIQNDLIMNPAVLASKADKFSYLAIPCGFGYFRRKQIQSHCLNPGHRDRRLMNDGNN
jgi:hypothetical protein